jgi:hypothetical protein
MAVGSVTSGAGATTTTTTSTADLSPVQRLVKQQQEEAARYKVGTDDEPYTEQDWYVNAKVAQLKSQINTYSSVPGLDPNGAIMDSLTQEVNALVTKQQNKLKASQAEAAKKQAELDAIEEAKKNAPLTADQLIERAKLRAEGKALPTEVSAEVQKLLDKSKGAIVDKQV